MKNIFSERVRTSGVFIVAFCAVNLYSQPVREAYELSPKQQAIVPVAAFIAKGELEKLKSALNEGLDAGLTVNEIKEIIIQMYAYCGFPRALNASDIFNQVLEDRKTRGINDVAGEEAEQLPAGKTSIETGAEIQSALTGWAVTPEPAANSFIPAIDQFLKGHLFGDIFGRGILDYKDREIATVSALAALGVPQLHGHIGIALRVGVTEIQMRNIISILETKVGEREAENARNALSRVLDTTAAETIASTDPQILIRREAQPVSKAPETNFTGDVDVQFMFAPNGVAPFSGAYVTFQPGARTAWHTHSAGQHMVVLSGVCWTQEWGKEKIIANPGDVVWCPPGVKHWHGSSGDSAMTHFVITGTGCPGQMQWLEKVSDKQYYGK
ncbi:MAG: carboxymuconolactone decarboxylase family protein [Treponema sp.]|jgi:quercetin dioxygenase-like cupin family protein/alkylhydroperoxidase/carboxymuconolactone decarboxylase family protein YurZ|nr:carboxymuconolactone decarboxylase family protein [Treponema sp.]